MLTLSVFPGIDLLGRGFESEGFCVVRGPDLIWGGDIRNFHPPANKFDGIIGGPPCPDFSRGRNGLEPTGNGIAMLAEYRRIVEAARPDWWILENVERTPDNPIPGYSFQRLDLWAHEFGMQQRRLRHIQFGDRQGRVLLLDRKGPQRSDATPTITATDTTTPWGEFIAAQGLPPNFELPTMTNGAARRAVGNGVPIPMATALARAIKNLGQHTAKPCACGCGRPVSNNSTYAKGSCRTRMHRKRHPGSVTPKASPTLVE